MGVRPILRLRDSFDGDGSADPAEIPAFVGALRAGADYAKGSRFLHGAGTTDMPFYRKLGNFGFVVLVRLLFGGRYSDITYGYNGFWRDVLPSLHLQTNGFDFEIVMNIRALRAPLCVVEVASFEHRRVYGKAKLRTFPGRLVAAQVALAALSACGKSPRLYPSPT